MFLDWIWLFDVCNLIKEESVPQSTTKKTVKSVGGATFSFSYKETYDDILEPFCRDKMLTSDSEGGSLNNK